MTFFFLKKKTIKCEIFSSLFLFPSLNLYLKVMSAPAQSAVTKGVLRKFIDSPAGPKTIHFWAPAMKWVNNNNNTKNISFVTKTSKKKSVWYLLVLEICNVLPKD